MGTIKDLGAALATLAGLAYATGYLVLRVRARVLGTEPDLSLLEEAYVFAGFRFLLIMLIALLLTLPLIAIVQEASLWLTRTLSAPALKAIEWFVLMVIAVVVLLEFQVMGVSHVLIEVDPVDAAGRSLVDAIVGRNNVGFWLVLGTTALTSLTALWLSRQQLQMQLFPVALAILVMLQILLLPVYHGAFFADRSIRVLAGIPATVTVLVAPVGVVDRNGERVTLLGNNREGKRRLATVGKDDLKGLATSNVTTLREFLDALTRTTMGVALAVPIVLGPSVSTDAMAEQSIPKIEAKVIMDTKKTNESFWQAVVGYLKNTFEYVGALGEGRARSGEVWVAELDGIHLRGPARRFAELKGLSWPVFGPEGSVYALEGQRIVRVGSDGKKTVLVGSQAQWVKLIGVNSDGSVLGIVEDPPLGKVAIWRADQTLTIGARPEDSVDRKHHAILLQESRVYTDGRRLVIRYSERGGRGLDVYVEAPGQPGVNLSDCGDDACGQPSLSPDSKRVAWIRSPAG